jgi:hypothetical protein
MVHCWIHTGLVEGFVGHCLDGTTWSCRRLYHDDMNTSMVDAYSFCVDGLDMSDIAGRRMELHSPVVA